jgi:F0F1-type ATP synthase membrane subunit a
MKNSSLIKAAVVLSSFSFLYSCSKSKDTNTDQLASLGKATITGRVAAKTVDTIGAATQQYAPSGTVIMAWIDTKDYVLGNDTTPGTAKRYFTATTDANGFYTLSVDVSLHKSAVVHILPNDFEYNVLYKNNLVSPATYYTDRHIFRSTTSTEVVNIGQKVISDISYN